MVTFWHLSQDGFLFSVFALPFWAIGCGVMQRGKWFFAGTTLEFGLLVASLLSLNILLSQGRLPGATGMEGLALVIQPAIFLASAAVGALLYSIAVWIADCPNLVISHEIHGAGRY